MYKLGEKDRSGYSHEKWEMTIGNYVSDGLSYAIDFIRRHQEKMSVEEMLHELGKRSDVLADHKEYTTLEDDPELDEKHKRIKRK
jgi:hypothetical protein